MKKLQIVPQLEIRQKNFQKMGQQIALQQKVEQCPESIITSSRSYTTTSDGEYIPKQGILKISINPFPYATRIGSTINGLPIYAEKCKSLQQQKTERKKNMNFFSREEILDLIESIVYTLASFEQQNVIYKDVSSTNIFLIKTNQRNQHTNKIHFKLLPNPLIQQTTYERLLNSRRKSQESNEPQTYNFSPEMIIAYRARQKQFNDTPLLKKSNVFSLGMVFLEAATLQSSIEFYDEKNFDIFQQVIEQNLSEVETRYGSTVVKIIANMIDFDFEERIQGFVELAKWIIIELENIKDQESISVSSENEDYNETFTPSLPQSPKSFNRAPFSKTNKINQIEEKVVEMMPVCHEKSQQTELKINYKSRLSLHDSQIDKQNKSTENKIKITVREVPVYLQKTTKCQDEKQSKTRLLHSPFVNTLRSSEYSSYERAKQDLLGHTKRSLAFEDNSKNSRNILNEFGRQNKICKTQR